ncbi:histidine triad nucleotide-binding protein [Clostridia bacterium]|nr:histidine triad nucleotide-binding protein [Clostridia bacterium]
MSGINESGDCIFCKIANGEIPAEKVYEDDGILAFADISPQAPVHVIIIPKRHIGSAAEIETIADAEIAGRIIKVAADIAREKNLDSGYRILTNIGEDGGQTVHHLHFHLLGGKKLGALG